MRFPVAAIESLLDRYYEGPRQRSDEAHVICCPWHEDSAPSCNIYPKSGVFFCWRCHFGKSKGVGPFEGFKAIGVPASELERLEMEAPAVEFRSQPLSFGGDGEEELVQQEAEEETSQVLRVEAWPEFWGWRDVRSSTLLSEGARQRFKPELAWLETKKGAERLPRISLTLANELGGASQVFLRLSSEQKPKAINAKGLNLKRGDFLPLGFPDLLRSGKLPRFLLLVEGPYDALRSYQHVLDLGLGGQVEVGALLGTGQWGHAWRDKFLVSYLPRFAGTLVLAFDQDDAGMDLTRQVVTDLKMYLPRERVKILQWTGPAKDPGDLDFSNFKSSWTKAF